jgi:hypothetical protein
MSTRLSRSISVSLLLASVVLAGSAAATAQPTRVSGAAMTNLSGASLPSEQSALFRYRRGPIAVDELSAEHRDGAVIRDITYTGQGGTPVRAYLVEPETAGPHPAILYLHWFEPPNPLSSRLEFLEEAVGMAGQGVVSLLPDLTFPWQGDPIGDRTDVDRVVEQTIQVRRGLDLLAGRDDVDRRHVAVVGHDYGGMYGLIVSALDRTRVQFTVAINVDATFSNWFARFWLGLSGEDTIRYEQLLRPIDTINYVCCGAHRGLLYQFSEPDFFIPDSTRRTLVSATSGPTTYKLYPGAEHELDDETARHDRISWLLDHLDAG